MTLKKLAETCGTSVATVSKAFSGSAEISDETRSRIFAEAKKAGCFQKYYKGKHERPIIALLFPETESDYYTRQIGFFERAITERGADTILALTRFDRQRAAELFSTLAYRMKVDGFIVLDGGSTIKNPDEIPLVTISSGGGINKTADNVIIKFDEGIEELIAVVKDYGHRRVGFIGERLTESKLRRFKSAMRKHGLPISEKHIVTAESRFAEGGEECMKKLIARGKLPTVIVAAYDQLAYGAMRYAKKMGIQIPDDISFVGMDDIAVTDYLDVPLTSLHTHTESICEKAIDLIFKRIDNRYYREKRSISVPVTLTLRESLAKYTKED